MLLVQGYIYGLTLKSNTKVPISVLVHSVVPEVDVESLKNAEIYRSSTSTFTYADSAIPIMILCGNILNA